MATPTVKSTYVLDVETAEALERLARAWQTSKSEVLRRVIRAAAGAPAEDRVARFRALQKAAALSPSTADRWADAVSAERRAMFTSKRRRRA